MNVCCLHTIIIVVNENRITVLLAVYLKERPCSRELHSCLVRRHTISLLDPFSQSLIIRKHAASVCHRSSKFMFVKWMCSESKALLFVAYSSILRLR